jgi:hypothetical protein
LAFRLELNIGKVESKAFAVAVHGIHRHGVVGEESTDLSIAMARDFTMLQWSNIITFLL